MKSIRLLPVFILCLLVNNSLFSQEAQAQAIDSIKHALAGARNAEEKMFWIDNLSRVLMNVDLQEAEKYGNEMIRLAEESRDRKLMVRAYMSNGLRCSYLAVQKEYGTRAIEYYNRAWELAKENRMDEETGAAQLRLSSVYLAVPDREKALYHVNQAFSLISTLANDSLKAEANNAYGKVYSARNEKILALRHYLYALRIAEDIKNDILIRNCYLNLSEFYKNIDQLDKAIDYYMLAYKQLDYIKDKSVPYQRAIDVNAIGNLFAKKSNFDIAINHFERSIAMADSLNFSNLKVPGYISLLNQYLRNHQPQKAMDYLKSPAGKLLISFIHTVRLGGELDQVYAVVYRDMGLMDSASYYFEKAIPYFEERVNESNKISFYSELAEFYKKKGDFNNALNYYTRVKTLSEKNGMLEMMKNTAKELDSLYTQIDKPEEASFYNAMYYQYKDSIQTLSRANELAQVEADDEQQRQDRLLKEREELRKKRYGIQYTGITVSIVIIFVCLVMMGWLKVSANTIKAIGFFAFILLFEFIFLLFKKNIYGFTNGEPLYDLVFMIALAAILVPLHHWLEHRVIRFLTSHQMLRIKSILTRRHENA